MLMKAVRERGGGLESATLTKDDYLQVYFRIFDKFLRSTLNTVNVGCKRDLTTISMQP